MPPVLTWRFPPAAELSWEKTAAVAVKIKLKRMGKIRAPFYRIIVADARTKRDGRAIEEIGKYHPKAEPSYIEVNSERALHWLSVGAQPTDPVRRILEITGDWQKFKGLPGTEGTLKTAEAKTDKKEAFAAAVAETQKAADAKPDKGKARKSAATDTAKAKDTKAASGKTARTDGKRAGGKSAKAADAPAEDGATEDAAASAASATAEDAAASAQDSAAPAEDSAASAEDTAAPAKDAAAPAKNAAAPAEDTAAPAEDAAAPAKDTASAGDKQDSEA
jgi:small subunit ribosomal protein S16